jgi:hypothetical protein
MGIFFLASDFSARTSDGVQVRRTTFFLAGIFVSSFFWGTRVLSRLISFTTPRTISRRHRAQFRRMRCFVINARRREQKPVTFAGDPTSSRATRSLGARFHGVAHVSFSRQSRNHVLVASISGLDSARTSTTPMIPFSTSHQVFSKWGASKATLPRADLRMQHYADVHLAPAYLVN